MHNIIQCAVASNPFLVEVESTFKSTFSDDEISTLFDYYTTLMPEEVPEEDEMVLRIEAVQYKQISYSYIPKRYFVLLHDNALMCEAMGVLMKDSSPELYQKYKDYFSKKRNTSSFANLFHSRDLVNPLFTSFLIRNTQNGIVLYRYGNYYSALHEVLQDGYTQLDQVLTKIFNKDLNCNHSCFLCAKETGEVDICQVIIVDDINEYGGEPFCVHDIPQSTDVITCKQIEEEFITK